MPATYTSRIRALQQEYNTNPESWGGELNDGALEILDASWAVTEITVGAEVTLTSQNALADQSRGFVLIASGAGGFAVITPAVDKPYLVINDCTADITMKPSGGTAATIRAGTQALYTTNAAGTAGRVVDPTLDKIRAPAASVAMNSQKITGMADPDDAQDAATKSYIDTLASSGNLATVAGIAADITTVAGIDTEVTAVAAIDTDVSAVAAIAVNVTTVAGNDANITTVAGINTAHLAAVAGVDTEIATLAPIAADITTAAGISADITAVAGDATDIGTVSTNIANVNAVAANASNINAVAGNATDISAVADIDADVSIVAGIAADVVTVAASPLSFASQAEAEAGTDNTKVMSPLRTAEAIAAQAAPSPMVLITDTTISGTPAAVDFTSGIDSTYDEYVLKLFKVKFGTDASDLWLRTDSGSGFETGASDYNHVRVSQTTAAATPSGTAVTTSRIILTEAVGNDTNEDGITGEIRVYKPSDAQYCTVAWELVYRSNTGALVTTRGVGQRAAAADVTGLRFLPNAGNFANDGVIRLYGVSNS